MENQFVYLNRNINPEEFGYLDIAKKVRELFGINKYHDVTNIEVVEYQPEQVTVKFKVVHYKVKSASSVPFQSVTFKEA